MRGIRLVGLLLAMVMLVAGLLVTAGPAAAEDGRQFVETSGQYSEGCSWDYAKWRWYPPDKYWFGQGWGEGGTSWTKQNGQLYLVLSTQHMEWHIFQDRVVTHFQISFRLYPVSSVTPDLSQVTGWYEGRMAENGVAHNPDPTTPPWWTGHFAGQGYGDFAGRTVEGTTVPTEWGDDPITGQRPGLCPGGALPFTNGTMTLRITGQP